MIKNLLTKFFKTCSVMCLVLAIIVLAIAYILMLISK